MVSVSLPVLIVGPYEQSEFRGTVDELLSRGALLAGNFRGALEIVESGYAPAAVVVLQSRPGQFSTSNFDELRRACPLARIVRVLGPWMEGELRTGRPVPGTLRVYWHDAGVSRLPTATPSNWRYIRLDLAGYCQRARPTDCETRCGGDAGAANRNCAGAYEIHGSFRSARGNC